MIRLTLVLCVLLMMSCGQSSTNGAGTGGGTGTGGSGGSGTGGGSGGSGGGSAGGGSGGGIQPGKLGAMCTAASECGSGFCVDGVCCNTSCEGLCTTCSGVKTTGAAGTCSPISDGEDPAMECPADTEKCIPGTCNGAGACGVSPDGTLCRGSGGQCDLTEYCLGGACPADGIVDAGVVCRAAVGFCDVNEVCDGTTRACPTDVVKPGNVTCRASQGDCDPLEMCDGVKGECPVDLLLQPGTVCRTAVSVCDKEEQCQGAAACPADLFAPQGINCRDAGGVCDVAETCTGSSNTCPADQFKGAETACGLNNFFSCPGTGVSCRTSCAANTDCFSLDGGVTCHDKKLCHNGKWAFISSASSGGNLGGLDGGDSFCTNLAADAGMSGSFRAWLGSDTAGPSTRFTKPNRPYYLLNGARLASSYTALTTTNLQVPFNVSELGLTVPATNPWSSVFNNGLTVAAQNCSNWTTSANAGTVATAGRYGNSTLVDSTWSFDNLNQCNIARRIYCFEQ